jgi:hypothetical protein
METMSAAFELMNNLTSIPMINASAVGTFGISADLTPFYFEELPEIFKDGHFQKPPYISNDQYKNDEFMKDFFRKNKFGDILNQLLNTLLIFQNFVREFNTHKALSEQSHLIGSLRKKLDEKAPQPPRNPSMEDDEF